MRHRDDWAGKRSLWRNALPKFWMLSNEFSGEEMRACRNISTVEWDECCCCSFRAMTMTQTILDQYHVRRSSVYVRIYKYNKRYNSNIQSILAPAGTHVPDRLNLCECDERRCVFVNFSNCISATASIYGRSQSSDAIGLNHYRAPHHPFCLIKCEAMCKDSFPYRYVHVRIRNVSTWYYSSEFVNELIDCNGLFGQMPFPAAISLLQRCVVNIHGMDRGYAERRKQ